VKPRRVLGYARVSSAEQALGTSLQDQQNAMAAYASSRGLTVARFYVESESAIREKVERREQIQALLRDVRAGDLVLCDKLDRWSRDIEFTHASVRQIKEAGAGFYAVAEALDASTNEGDFMLGIRAVLAKEEHRRIRIRTVGTRALLREQGYYAEGTPPFGYRRQLPKGARGLEKNVLVIVPAEADVVREVFARYLRGRSMAQVAAELDTRIDFVKRILDRRTYLGEVKTARGWVRGHHEAIVDAASFARVREIVESRRLGGARPRGTPAETSGWILRDVARCAHCDARMSAAYAGPKGARRYYYRCAHKCQSRGDRSNTGAYVAVAAAEEQAAVLVLERLAELRGEVADGPPERARRPAAATLDARRAELARRRDRALEAHEKGYRTLDELGRALARLDAAGLRLDAEAADVAAPHVLTSASARRDALRELGTLKRAWQAAQGEERRRIVNVLAEAVHIRADALPCPRWRSIDELVRELLR
jgi:site-specific DNA recombinase